MALAMLIPAQADNYFTMGKNDSIRINPAFLDYPKHVPVYAHFDGRLDCWQLVITYPTGLSYSSSTQASGMHVPFVNRNGTDSIYDAYLSVTNNGSIISSIINEFGYWDPDGNHIYDTYGTVKWEAGDHQMIDLTLMTSNSMAQTSQLIIYGILSSTADWRGGTIGEVIFYKYITVYVGYRKGDLNGDEVITPTDATILTNYILNETGLNDYQLAAADVNGDGVINPTDITVLNNMLLNGVNGADDEMEL